MAKQTIKTEIFKNGLPYFSMGGGNRKMVVFEGLNFVHKPLSSLGLWMMSGSFKGFTRAFAVYYVSRKAGLPEISLTF